MKALVKDGARVAQGVVTRLRMAAGHVPRFAGAFPSRAAALASLPETERAAYDRDDITDVSLQAMTQVAVWDYPVIYWLDRLAREGGRLSLLDAGGHLGTKYLAFADHLERDRFDWTVWDLPALLRAGRARQALGDLPATLRFADSPGEAGEVDLLLGSGLLQYLDIPLGELVGRMAAPPRWMILNKVATRDGPELVTLERIGPTRVPYRIRARTDFEAELDALGYRLLDSWTIPSLSHRVATHPWLGASESRGYLLERQ